VDLLGATWGTLVNAGAVLAGTVAGLLLRGRMPDRTGRTVMQGVGLATLFVGARTASDLLEVRVEGVSSLGIPLALIAVLAGGWTGETLGLEERLEGLGERLKRAFRGTGPFTEAFVTSSLLFCVGPLTLVGAIQNGLTGDGQALVVKSGLDGVSSLALASALGPGVALSILTILVYQGGLSVAAGSVAGLVAEPASHPLILLVSGVGGLLILGLGVNLLLAGTERPGPRVRVTALLPALLTAAPVYGLAVLTVRVFS
jgi:uncharacterized membrane protein YqgA involved in biofilm formation